MKAEILFFLGYVKKVYMRKKGQRKIKFLKLLFFHKNIKKNCFFVQFLQYVLTDNDHGENKDAT
jgi:hypothetical protein